MEAKQEAPRLCTGLWSLLLSPPPRQMPGPRQPPLQQAGHSPWRCSIWHSAWHMINPRELATDYCIAPTRLHPRIP